MAAEVDALCMVIPAPAAKVKLAPVVEVALHNNIVLCWPAVVKNEVNVEEAGEVNVIFVTFGMK